MRRWVILLAALAASCSRDPQEVATRHLASAERYIEKRQYREAEILLKRVIKSNPRLAVAYAKLADIQIIGKRVGEAVYPLRRAIELLPDGPERQRRRAQLGDALLFYLEQAHQNSQVIEETDALASALGNTYDGYRIRGRLYTIQARALAASGGISASSIEMREAIVVLRKAEALRPLTDDVTIPLARSLWLEDDKASAIRLLTDLTAKDPHSLVAWSDLVRFLEMDSKLDEAERHLRAAIQANPKHYPFYLRLASHWRARRDLAKSEAAVDLLRATRAVNPYACEQIARYYRESREWDKAVSEFELAKKDNPSSATLLDLQIVDVWMTSDQREKARGRIAELLKRDGKNPAVRVRHAALLFEDGKTDEAIKELEVIAKEIPSDFATHYNLGRARRRAGQFEMARLALLECLRLNPPFLPAERELMAVLVQTEQWGSAMLSAEKVLRSGRDLQAALVRASALRHLGKANEALAQLQVLKEWGAPESLRLLELGKLEAAAGRKEQAIKTFRAAFAAGSTEALIEASLLYGTGIEKYEAIVGDCKKHPDNAPVQMVCADVALIAGKLDIALAAYEAALAKSPDSQEKVRLLMRSGETLRRAGKVADAVKRLESAAQVQPDNAEISHLLGIALDQSGRRPEAIAAYEKSLKGNPNNAIVLNNLAWHMYQSGGDLDVAQTYAQRARQLSPNNLEFSDTLGMIYLRKNLKQNAVAIFRELVQKSPGNAAFREHLRQAESGT